MLALAPWRETPIDDAPHGRDKSRRARSNPVAERRLDDRRLAVK
jgi:hypothetical protein